MTKITNMITIMRPKWPRFLVGVGAVVGCIGSGVCGTDCALSFML